MGCSSSLEVMARLVSPESLAEAGPSEEQSDADGHALAKTMEDGNHLVASNEQVPLPPRERLFPDLAVVPAGFFVFHPLGDQSFADIGPTEPLTAKK